MRPRSLVLASILIVVMVLVTIIYIKRQKTNNKFIQYEIQFAYPVTSINPVLYDDWESVFVGNHIYYRLIPDKNKPWLPSITQKITFSCQQPQSQVMTDNCKIVKISFVPKQFNDCLGRTYTKDDLRKEFEKILSSKEWLVPKWKKCNESKDSICVNGEYIPDQIRRLQAIGFRFGWSKTQMKDGVYGAGPYCLKGRFHPDGGMYTGVLMSLFKNEKLPVITFHTSQDKNENFQFALYGNKNLLNNRRKNIQLHTPLAYYVITNPHLDKFDMPWNQIEAKEIIKNFLIKKDVLFPITPHFFKFAPEGNALNKSRKRSNSGVMEFVIPNYLSDCESLANSLNQYWGGRGGARAKCKDIVDYVYSAVVKKKMHWYGFLVGISANDPSKDSLRDQYFSSYSSASWTYDYDQPENLFYLIGIGQSLATVDGERVCNIRPNPLGLSDLLITDLIPCSGK